MTTMKFLPTTKDKWLRLLSFPFKSYIFGVGLLFPYWRLRMPGKPGMIGGGDLTEWLTRLSVGCFISFLALMVICVIQVLIKCRRDAMWNVVFAILALLIGLLLIPPSLR